MRCDLQRLGCGQVGMACSGTVGGLARAPMKMCATVEPTRSMLIDAMAEVIAVAKSEGVEMDPGFAVETADRYANGPNNTTVRPTVALLLGRERSLASNQA